MNIVDIIKDEIIKRSNKFEEDTKGTKDEYNLYNEHIKYVYKYVLILSKNKNVDLEVLSLSALLHDISMTDKNLDRSKHNEYGALIAEQILRDNNYPEDKISLVKKCILNHSSKCAIFRSTEEEQILVDADCLSHFDSIKSIYSLASKVIGLDDNTSLQYIKDKLTRDYNELSDNIKYLIEDKYFKIMNANDISVIDEIDNIDKRR